LHLQQKVFEPFFTTKPTGKGTGLGLSQVYGIAQQCGGTARLTSSVDAGTTVELWLPVSNAVPESAARYDAGDSLAGTVRGESILIVEDDNDVRRFIVECLTNFGYNVTEAENGHAGLDVIQNMTPNLLIVDFAMPGLNGAELATTVRSHHPELPIIFVTGYADMDAVERVTGTKFLLRKPFDVANLANIVREALGPRLQPATERVSRSTSEMGAGTRLALN
jgi:CheY-like chemotaxis protein